MKKILFAASCLLAFLFSTAQKNSTNWQAAMKPQKLFIENKSQFDGQSSPGKGKVLFGTDAYPYSDQLGWEESGWIAARTARQALALALTGMMRDGEISRDRALELARMVLRENARRLYGL